MINPNNEFAIHAYEQGFAHGLDASIPAPYKYADRFYQLGFKAARNGEAT